MGTAGARAASIDALRGLVIAIMALDHTREFFHSAAMLFTPEDFTRTWPALFLTRWITHICAPAFLFLAGLSAYLWQSRGRTPGQLTAFLLKRGLWLILLDLVVMRFAMFFSLASSPVILSILWAIGWSMLILALLIHLPRPVLAIASIALILFHNLADNVPASAFGAAAWLWNIFHQQGVFTVAGAVVFVAYPLAPWFAVMACGYCLGPAFTSLASGRRQRLLLAAGLVMTAAFLVLRGVSLYGDPRPWDPASPHPVLSFLNTTKYPPSLAFLSMTLGPALLILGAFDRLSFSPRNPLLVFGRVPLFFFVVHFFLIHLLAFPFAAVRYGNVAFLLQPMPSMGGGLDTYPAGFGYSLGAVYLVWLLVLLLMYPLCRYLGALKERRSSWWLAYV